VLFLCTGNSARSLLAECLLNRYGAGSFQAFSGGSTPTGSVHPLALELLESKGYDTTGLRSKSWDEFSQPGALPFDLIVTLCDRAKEEACPVWPGQPVVAHWGFEDPAACVGSRAARRAAFLRVFSEIQRRIQEFVASGIASPSPSNGGP